MRIGIDIDGVLNYRQEIVIACGTKFCVETGQGHLQDLSAHHLRTMFGWDEAARLEFWTEYGWQQMMLWPAQAYAAEVIAKLHQAGHEIWIVTARNERDPSVKGKPQNMTWQAVTEEWLAKNHIQYDKMCFDTQDKAGFCRDHHLDVMVEDNPDYLAAFNHHTKVLIYDQPYNRNLEIANSSRVYSWYEVLNEIHKLEH